MRCCAGAAASPMTEPETLPQMFQATALRLGQRPALKAKLSQGGWRVITWAGYQRYVQELAAFLLSLGVEKGDRVALLAKNSPEWVVTDFATLHAGAVMVGIYETLAPDKVEYILRDSGARLAFAGSRAQAEQFLGMVKGTKLELVVCFEPVKGKLGKQCIDWDDALAQGKAWLQQHKQAVEERWRAVQPDDLAALIYTSGTTGEPKGVMLSHHNFVSNVVSSLSVFPLGENDQLLSFLPLCHSYERMAGHYSAVYVGATVAYAESREKLPENLLEVRPTVMTSVPLLFEKMWQRVEAAAREGGKEKIFRKALEVGREHARVTRRERGKPPLGLKLKYRLFDKLVFSKVRARVGGNVKFFVTGGAHIREELEWNFTAVGLPILGGYGLTESSPVISVNTLEHWRPGSVGRPIPGVEVRIAEDGEILARGPNVMRGYFNKPEETKKTLTEDGWLRTGDIGRLDEEGFLYVTDRKKELFKTKGGKYIAPQPIEDLLRGSPLVGEAVCIGDDRKYVTALLVPNFENLVAWARKEGLPAEDRSALLVHPRVREALQQDVDKANARLSGFETIKKWVALEQEFTQEGGELTPTLKVKRRVVNEKYREQIEGMYAGATSA